MARLGAASGQPPTSRSWSAARYRKSVAYMISRAAGRPILMQVADWLVDGMAELLASARSSRCRGRSSWSAAVRAAGIAATRW